MNPGKIADPAPQPSIRLFACQDCDLVVSVPRSIPAAFYCPRCQCSVLRRSSSGLRSPSALYLAAGIFFVIANCFPIVRIEAGGNSVQATVVGAVLALHGEHMNLIAILVGLTTVVIPAAELFCTISVLVLADSRRPFGILAYFFRLRQTLRPWNMVEILMLGIIVAVVKLGNLASVVLGTGLWALGAFMIAHAAASHTFDPKDFWNENQEAAMSADLTTASSRGLLSCPVCGLLSRDPKLPPPVRCSRCTTVLAVRKPDSLRRSSALLIAAAIMYVPANVLPILRTTSVAHTGEDTIISGIIALWSGGSWPLALLVFFASILVPSLKFVILGFLIWSTHRGWQWGLHDRSVLYRLIEFIGRWSMLDVFVVTLMVTLVQLRGIATIDPGAGVLAFAAVVVLMMYAAQAFDPRLMWDRGSR